ncbi:ABC transporter substrate-binding protein, partial [Streptomyces sp. JAC18]
AGNRDEDGDGGDENKDGPARSLKLAVPAGWTEWMKAAKASAAGAGDAGSKVTAEFADQNASNELRGEGDIDLVINNERQ